MNNFLVKDENQPKKGYKERRHTQEAEGGRSEENKSGKEDAPATWCDGWGELVVASCPG